MAKDLKELQESDVIFPDHHHVHHHNNNNTCFDYQEMNHHNSRVSRNSNSSKDYNKRMANSLPVNIPGSIFHHGNNNSFEDDEREGEEMVPPHVITRRRVEGKMAFSVCTGNGRTLKGRDLSKVRNSILRMTGFLETWPDQLYTHIYMLYSLWPWYVKLKPWPRLLNLLEKMKGNSMWKGR